MLATLATIDCYSTLGVEPSECDECEGRTVVTFLRGPYEEVRECEQCRGTGWWHPCPNCSDGTNPATGDTCEICNGYSSLH